MAWTAQVSSASGAVHLSPEAILHALLRAVFP